MRRTKLNATLPALSEEASGLLEELNRETDRGAALLAAAFLDDVLDALIRARFVDDPEATNRLLTPGRPIESFGARTHLAYCIGLLGPDVYADINAIREIRNEFAHRQPSSFASPEVRGRCEKLRIISVLRPDDACTGRERFIVSVVMLANHLIAAGDRIKRLTAGRDFASFGVLRLR
jgi:DNA-binding MltR family transcriptional regulator